MTCQIDLRGDFGCSMEIDLISYLLNTADGEILISYTKVYTEWRTLCLAFLCLNKGQRTYSGQRITGLDLNCPFC
jgi:hypothetical protein